MKKNDDFELRKINTLNGVNSRSTNYGSLEDDSVTFDYCSEHDTHYREGTECPSCRNYGSSDDGSSDDGSSDDGSSDDGSSDDGSSDDGSIWNGGSLPEVEIWGSYRPFYNPNPIFNGQEILYLGSYETAYNMGRSGSTWDFVLATLIRVGSAAAMGSDFGQLDPGMTNYSQGIHDGYWDGRKAYQESQR